MTEATDTANPRELAVRVLSDYRSGESLQGRLNHAIQTHELIDADRALLTELVLSSYRNRRWLRERVEPLLSGDWKSLPPEVQWVLITAVHQLEVLSRIPDYAAVDEAVELTKQFQPELSGVVNGVLRNYLRHREDEDVEPPVPGLGGYFRKQLDYAFGEEAADEIADTAGERYYTGIWFEPDSGEAEDLRAELRENGHLLYADIGGYRFPYLLDMPEGGAEAVRERGAHLMGVSSQLVARLAGEVALHLETEPLEILDGAAGRGNKALYLAHFLDAAELDFRLTLVDSDAGKLERARERLSEFGERCEFHQIELQDTQAAADELGRDYDLVLLDAPCTGSGSFRKLPHKLSYLEPKETEKTKPLQWEMLTAGFGLTAEEGMLLYAVCSFFPEEGEFHFNKAAEEITEFQPLPPPLEVEKPLFQAGYCVRIAPVEPYLESFTIGVARKGLLTPEQLGEQPPGE